MVSGSFHFARLHDIGESEKGVWLLTTDFFTINYEHDQTKKKKEKKNSSSAFHFRQLKKFSTDIFSFFSFFFPGLSSLTCSQIWLNPLVDDCHCDYITQLKTKNLGWLFMDWANKKYLFIYLFIYIIYLFIYL